MSIVERIERLGIRVTAEEGQVVLEGNTRALAAEQMEWVKAHKPDILRELRGRVVSRLGTLAKAHHIPLDDLLDWYRGDLEDMTRLDKDALEWLVGDYASLHDYYRTGKQEEVA